MQRKCGILYTISGSEYQDCLTLGQYCEGMQYFDETALNVRW
jgi:hypothetical protein